MGTSKTKALLIVLFFQSLFYSSVLFSAETGKEKDNIAVLDFKGRNVADQDAAVFSDMLRTDLVQSGMCNVLDKANMDRILAEVTFQQTGATDTEYAAKIGKVLNVQKMVVGTVSRLEGQYYINASLVDVQSGIIEKSEILNYGRASNFLDAAKDLTSRFMYDVREEAESPAYSRGKKFSVGIGAPYVSLGYDITSRYTVELRYAADFFGNEVKIYDARVYYNSASEKFNWYTALEGGMINFLGYTNYSQMKSTQDGYMVGIFLGTRYNISRAVNVSFDIGPSYISLHDTVMGIEWIINTGVNVYVF